VFVVEFYLKLKLILRIITYLTHICWEIDNFVIKSDIFRRFFICKIILKKLSCYHDNYFRYFTFGKYNGFVSKARVSACMYFLVIFIYESTSKNFCCMTSVISTDFLLSVSHMSPCDHNSPIRNFFRGRAIIWKQLPLVIKLRIAFEGEGGLTTKCL
jgi:hypothetical protein